MKTTPEAIRAQRKAIEERLEVHLETEMRIKGELTELQLRCTHPTAERLLNLGGDGTRIRCDDCYYVGTLEYWKLLRSERNLPPIEVDMSSLKR